MKLTSHSTLPINVKKVTLKEAAKVSILEKHVESAPTVTEESSCETRGCCSTTEDGNAVCSIAPSVEVIDASSKPKNTLRARIEECKTVWQKIRGGVMFVIACIASPCCTPLLIPVVLAVLAGTPAALWISSNLGWVFGGLTLLSVVSFVLAFRWMGKKANRRVSSNQTRL